MDTTANAPADETDQEQIKQPSVAGVVYVLGVGKKSGSVLRIAGKRVKL